MAAVDVAADIAAIAGIAAVPTILDVVCRVTGMGFAAVARVTHEQWVVCAVQDGIAFGLQPGGELDLDSTICRSVRDRRTPVVINHVAEDTTYCAHPTPALYGFQSYISMPIVLPDGTFFGTLCAIDPAPNKLDTPEVIGMFKLFAELIAFQLEASGRVATAESKVVEERETAVLREQFIAVLGHDLRNPLQALSSGLSQLLRKPDRAEEIIGYMRSSIGRMAGLIENVLDLARGRLGGGLTLDRNGPAPLEPTLDHVVAELQAIWPDRTIATEFALAGPVDCDHGRVAQLFSNLLGNALTHSPPDTPVTVRATTTDGLFRLSVANAGPPIAGPVQERLFQPFFRANAGAPQQGLGLGLYIASEIARAHGGGIDVASTPAETRFTFRMPIAPPG